MTNDAFDFEISRAGRGYKVLAKTAQAKDLLCQQYRAPVVSFIQLNPQRTLDLVTQLHRFGFRIGMQCADTILPMFGGNR